MRVGVLVSGRGSNLQALLDAKDLGAEIAVVVSNVADVFALARAAKSKVATATIPHAGYKDRAAFDAAVLAELRKHRVDLVCLAGFMRIVGPAVLDAFPDRVLNIHPSLLPAFPGLHAHRQVLAAGVRWSGATVHLVDRGTDTGPILLQAVVPVLPGDDEDALAARTLVAEHRIYPEAVRLMAAGRVKIAGRKVTIDGVQSPPEGPIFNPRIG